MDPEAARRPRTVLVPARRQRRGAAVRPPAIMTCLASRPADDTPAAHPACC